ncbi:hypothetical protein U1Q18_018124 [Sarracenia purpurea var. burkii]
MQANPEESELIKSPILSSDFQGKFEEVTAETCEVYGFERGSIDCQGSEDEVVGFERGFAPSTFGKKGIYRSRGFFFSDDGRGI